MPHVPGGRSTRLARGVGCALLAGLFLQAPSPAMSQQLQLEPHLFVSQAGDSVAAEWGRLEVPAVRGRPGSGTIELNFVLFPSTSDSPGPPIVYLAGGPGSSGINSARFERFPLFMAMRELGDVIALDQRGSNASNPLGDGEDECEIFLPRPLDRPLEDSTLVALGLEAARECAGRWREMGIDLSAYNTRENAADLLDLGRALGAPRVRIWAISYGTHLALSLLRDHPGFVERAVLAGVEGPDHTIKLPELSEYQLRRLHELVAADPVQSARVPDLIGMVRDVLDRLERQPVTLEFVPPDGSRATQVVVGAPELKRLTIGLLRDPWNMVGVPRLYERVAAADFSDFDVAPRVRFEFEAMPEAMDAASGMSAERMDRFRAQERRTVLGGGAQIEGALMASAIGVEDLGEGFRADVETDVPTLFISGTLDGRTPVSNATEVIAGFTDARHLVIENAGHSDDLFLSSPDIAPLMLDFMKGDPVGDRGVVVPPPAFSSLPDPAPIPPEIGAQLVGEYEREPGDLWRILPAGTVRTRDARGRLLTENARLQIRFDGNGFPLRRSSDGSYYVDFPGIRERPITFEWEDSRVVALSILTGSGALDRMPKRTGGSAR